MTRKKVNPSHSLGRFMFGIYDYYADKGMPRKTAKARMMDHTMEEAVKLIKAEEEVPDELLMIMSQWMSRALTNRGAQLLKKFNESSTEQNNHDLQPLQEIKSAKDAMDRFIENYKKVE